MSWPTSEQYLLVEKLHVTRLEYVEYLIVLLWSNSQCMIKDRFNRFMNYKVARIIYREFYFSSMVKNET